MQSTLAPQSLNGFCSHTLKLLAEGGGVLTQDSPRFKPFQNENPFENSADSSCLDHMPSYATWNTSKIEICPQGP